MSISAQISIAPDTVGRMVSMPFVSAARGYLAYKKTRFKQDAILSKIHHSLSDFPRLCILNVDIVDYTAPLIEDECLLIRIEPNMSDVLGELLQLWGMDFGSISDFSKFGKYVFAFGLLQVENFGKYLRNLYSTGSNKCEPVLVGGDTVKVESLFQNPLTNEILEIEVEDVREWLNCSLVKESVSDLKTAVSFKSPDFPLVKFSRITHSANYMENGTIKFDGLREGNASLQRLSTEFPYLHDCICFLQNHPDFKTRNGIWKDFRMFLLAIANMLESDHMLLPTPKMIEKKPDWQFNYNFWHEIRQFMENCCKFILGGLMEIEIPQISYPKDPNVERKLKDLAIEIDRTAKNLQSTLSKFTEFQLLNQQDEPIH